MRVAPAYTLGLLAGGFSGRMGRDKATLPVRGLTLLQWAARRYAGPGVPVLVGTREDGPGRDSGFPWVPDLVSGQGPFTSMAALLAACETPFLLVIPCDQTHLPPDVGDRMLRYMPGVEGVLFRVDDRRQPFPALLSRELAPLFRSLVVDHGCRRADAWWDRAPGREVPFLDAYPDLDGAAFHSLNNPEDLRRFHGD